MVPTCDSCHGAPHAAGIMQKFPKCYDCHYIAHDLNDWSAVKKESSPAAKKESPKKK
jgi:cytochrome c553